MPLRPDDFNGRLVPKGLTENLLFRRRVIKLGCADSDYARELWIMCKRDLLFWMNTFVWTFNPRKKPSALPFITWEYQDGTLLEMDRILGKEDLGMAKSRDMGATWMVLMLMLWRWQFHDLETFMLVSRKEDLVDKAQDPDTLFAKIDFALKYQPEWLKPKCTRNKLHLYNHSTGSTINGGSTTSDVTRGGRRTAIMFDEFASVDSGHAVMSASADVTECRLFISTPKGSGNAFYDIMNMPEYQDIKKVRLHWSVHPEKSLGLSYDTQGKPHSTWYDAQTKRRSPYEIAQELDIDFLGSDYQYFEQSVLDRVESEDCRAPIVCGDLDFDPLTCEPAGFIEASKGPLSLWAMPDGLRELPHDRQYVVGADISAGTGASNSVLSIGDRRTKDKIGEYVTKGMNPIEFARLAVALCRWLYCEKEDSKVGAYLIWESNGGPGQNFGTAVIENGYRNFYYRQNLTRLGKPGSDQPGWHSTKDTKQQLLMKYRQALSDGSFTQHSKAAVRECREYVYVSANNSVAHSRSINTIDPSASGDNHGDRVIADALLNLGLGEVGPVKPKEPPMRVDCMRYRQLKHERRRQEDDLW